MKKMTRMEGAMFGLYFSLLASSILIFVAGLLAVALMPYSPVDNYLLVRVFSGMWAVSIIGGTIYGFCKPHVVLKIIP
ncbi:MAG: hypothetical protein SFV17_12790 [Candidatus Obscuribacter sp.]|nr:hypothetical protein [Candidatus Obscuribacter sp.]